MLDAMLSTKVPVGTVFPYTSVARAEMAAGTHFSKTVIGLAPMLRAVLAGAPPQLVTELTRLPAAVKAAMDVTMTPWDLRFRGAAVFCALVFRTECGDASVDLGDEIFAASMGACVRAAVPGPAHFLVRADLQHAFVIRAVTAMRLSKLATSLSHVSTRSVVLTVGQFAAVPQGFAWIAAAGDVAGHVVFACAVTDGRMGTAACHVARMETTETTRVLEVGAETTS